MAEAERWKRCVRFGEYKPHAAFNRTRSNFGGLQRHRRHCATSGHRRAPELPALGPRGNLPEGHKRCRGYGTVKKCGAVVPPADHLRRKYGITPAERDEMIASPMGLCAICPEAPAVHVDHCHKTGRVRGVLCFNCNSGLGLLRDDPAAAYRAADYLEGNAWKPTLVAPGVYRLPS